MSAKRLFCLAVKPLYLETKSPSFFGELLPIPTMCLCDFKNLINIISNTITLLKEYGLNEASQSTVEATWFFQQTNRYHLNIPTQIHITLSHVYFSGCFPPHQEAYFKTSAIPVSEVLETEAKFKNIDLARLKYPQAKGVINEIMNKDAQYMGLLDLNDNLDDIKNNILKLDEKTTDELTTDLNKYNHSLSSEISKLSQKASVLELEIEAAAKKLLFKIFDLSVGDWIVCDQSVYRDKQIQLQINQVSYYDRLLTLQGPIITKKGEQGKRTETINIQILPNDEHQ
ncbi:hypothetical protein WNY63_17770 [Pseudoalteromonas neustonica]|uniref:Uncharacterized protein n=1 Tax=Pseudoalteromonas neustonica TaxID=1840331 RepID=A0ABU9U6C1_9GAMM